MMPTSLSILVALSDRALRWSAGAERVVGELFEGQLLASGWVTGGEQAAGWQGALYKGE